MALTQVKTDGINADSVTAAKIADDAVGAEHIEQLDADLSFADNVHAKFGAGNDLQIDHSGTNSQIYHDGTGHLYIATQGSGEDLIIQAKNEFKVSTADSERMRIDSSGNVGIGTASPNSFTNYTTLTINGGSDGAGIDLELSDNNIYGRFFADTNGLQIQSAQSGDSIRFETNGSNVRARITDDGLCFGSDTAAANALDDYEEGTWTPTVSSGMSSPTYSHQRGGYVKVGRFVYFQFDIDINGGTGDSNHLKIGGLPFTSESSSTYAYGGAFMTFQNSFLTQGTDVTLHIGLNSTDVKFYKYDGNWMSGNSGSGVNDLTANIIVNGVYMAAT